MKVELHMRYVHFQKKLQDKFRELEELNSREQQLLAGSFDKGGTCNGVGNLGDPSSSTAASSVCCFCPTKDRHMDYDIPSLVVVNPKPSTATISIIQPNSDIEEAKLQHVIQQRSKSLKVMPDKSSRIIENEYYAKPEPWCLLTAYPNCRSSRELQRDTGEGMLRSNSGRCQFIKGFTEKCEQVKPASSDSLISTGTTKSFGGYGYGYGYGYFSSSSTKEVRHRTSATSPLTVTHPHHHNHHIHSKCSHDNNYYQPEKCRSDASKVRVVYNYVAPTYHTMLPKTANFHCSERRHWNRNDTPTKQKYRTTENFEEQSCGAKDGSKTLPYTRPTAGLGGTNCSFEEGTITGKLQKTLSDSSLTDHYKEFPTAYFQRSGDNVRISNKGLDIDPNRTGAQKSLHQHGTLSESGSFGGSKRKGRSKSVGKEHGERIFV